MELRNLMEEHELFFKEVLTGTVEFVLVDPPYNVQRNQNDAHAAYNVFGLNEMTDMTKVLGDVMKTGADEHVFCSTQQFAL